MTIPEATSVLYTIIHVIMFKLLHTLCAMPL